MRVTPEGYGHMTQMLLGLAEGKVILVLEVGFLILLGYILSVLCSLRTRKMVLMLMPWLILDH